MTFYHWRPDDKDLINKIIGKDEPKQLTDSNPVTNLDDIGDYENYEIPDGWSADAISIDTFQKQYQHIHVVLDIIYDTDYERFKVIVGYNTNNNYTTQHIGTYATYPNAMQVSLEMMLDADERFGENKGGK